MSNIFDGKYSKPFFKNKKGQAAIEFMATYGWALIIGLGVIAVFNYYGMFDLSRYFPDVIDFPEEFEVFDHMFSATTGDFNLALTNRVGFAFQIEDVKITSPDTVVTLTCDNRTPYKMTWNESKTAEFFFTCNFEEVGFESGRKGHLLFNLTYYADGSDPSYLHSSLGDISAILD